MARTPRIEGENLWYHVFNRGIEKRDIFFNDDDRSLLLDIMFETAADFNVEIHTYALMPNHFHFFIKTLEPNLCRFMHSSMNKFVKNYNLLNNRVGTLFQGPYKPIVVDSNDYGHILSRYIHLNWVRGYGKENLSIKKKLAVINKYQWSSYRAFADLESSRWPVKTKDILADFGNSTQLRHKNYVQYVKEGLLKESNPFDDVIARTILGGDGFVRSIKDLLKKSKRHDKTADHLALSILSPKIQDVIDAIEAEFQTPSDLFLAPRPVQNSKFPKIRIARNVFLWTAAKACAGRLSLKQIAANAGAVSPMAVASARNRIDNLKIKDSQLAQKCKNTLNRLNLIESVLPSDKWAASFKQLELYKNEFGHCLVPNDYPPNQSLGSWVAAQKQFFKNFSNSNNQVIQYRIERLKNLGVSWMEINQNDDWEEMFLDLKAFKRLFGHCNVPKKWSVKPEFAKWVAQQHKNNINSYYRDKLQILGLF